MRPVLYTVGGTEETPPMPTDTPTEKFKRANNRRKPAPVKNVTLSPEARKAYEDLLQERDKREERGRFLPEEFRSKR